MKKNTPHKKSQKKPKIEFQKAENNFTLFIFGASGSLAKLKLFPAIYELVKEKELQKNLKLLVMLGQK